MTKTSAKSNKNSCLRCGKSISLSGRKHPVIIENNGKNPELEDTLCFCSKDCFMTWATNYKNQKTKKRKQSIKQKLLQNIEKQASNDDLYDIYYTLSSEEKREMIIHALALCYSLSDHTIGGVLNQISRLKERRENKEKMFLSDI